VGGSKAGLAIGYFLGEEGLQLAILERGESIAPAWRELNSDIRRLFQEDGYFALELDGREQAKVLKSLGGKPLAVVSADRDQQRGWAASQAKLAQLSSNSFHRKAHGSTRSALLEDMRFASITTRTIADCVRVTHSAPPLR
jgi:hypothetical protein